MKTSVCLVRPDNFKQKVISETKPVLLVCMHYGEEFHSQKKIIDEIADQYCRVLKVGLVDEEFIETFKINLGIHGTPTFLIIYKGKEQNRILGSVDQQTLTDFIFGYLKKSLFQQFLYERG